MLLSVFDQSEPGEFSVMIGRNAEDVEEQAVWID